MLGEKFWPMCTSKKKVDDMYINFKSPICTLKN